MEFGPRARLAQHPRRPGHPPQPRHAVGAEPQDQVPRVVPPVRAVGAPRAGRRGLRDAAAGRQTVHAADGLGARVSPDAARRGRERSARARQAAGVAVRHPGRHPRRLFCTGADRGRGAARALRGAAAGLRGEDRLPGADQLEPQRAGRAHRLRARACLALLSDHEHGRAGAGALSAPQAGAAGRVGGRAGIPAGSVSTPHSASRRPDVRRPAH